MNNCFKLVLTLLALRSFTVTQSFSKSGYLLISANDCVNTSAKLQQILRVTDVANWKIIFQQSFKDDSVILKEKFGIGSAQVIWSDSLYKSLGGSISSKVLLLDSNGRRSEYDIKHLNIDELNIIRDNWNAETEHFKMPTSCEFSVYDGNIFFLDLLKGTIGRYGSKNFKLAMTDELVEHAYLQYFGKEDYQTRYIKYLQETRNAFQLQPAITSFQITSDSSLSFLSYVYLINDTSERIVYSKLLCLTDYDYKRNRVMKSDVLRFAERDSFYVTGLSFSRVGEHNYFGLEKAVTKDDQDLRFLSRIEKDSLASKKMSILPMVLPEEYVKQNIYYSMGSPVVRYPYAMWPASSTLFNLANNSKARISGLDASIRMSRPMEAMSDPSKITYMLFYLAYSTKDDNLILVYYKLGKWYWGKYAPKVKRLEEHSLDNLTATDVNGVPHIDLDNCNTIYYFSSIGNKLVRKMLY
jgi:hypothetical protein